MANRIILGQRNPGEYGMWVSKPGANAYTAGEFDLLLDAANKQFQYVASGIVALQRQIWLDITTPDLGYKPYVIGFSNSRNQNNDYGGVLFQFTSNTNLRLQYLGLSASSDAAITYRYMIIGGPQHG